MGDNAIIFDIGANIGYFSLLFTKRLKFKGSIYLFEPVPHLAELCKKTFSDQPFPTTVFNFGLGNKDEELDIFVDGDGNLGWNTIISQKSTQDMVKIPISLKSFSKLGLDVVPSFIKIDVEGAEHKVLEGLLPSLRNYGPLPVVLCEVGWGMSHPAWDREMRVFAKMKQIGYSICDLDGISIDPNSIDETTDILFIPKTNSATKL